MGLYTIINGVSKEIDTIQTQVNGVSKELSELNAIVGGTSKPLVVAEGIRYIVFSLQPAARLAIYNTSNNTFSTAYVSGDIKNNPNCLGIYGDGQELSSVFSIDVKANNAYYTWAPGLYFKAAIHMKDGSIVDEDRSMSYEYASMTKEVTFPGIPSTASLYGESNTLALTKKDSSFSGSDYSFTSSLVTKEDGYRKWNNYLDCSSYSNPLTMQSKHLVLTNYGIDIWYSLMFHAGNKSTYGGFNTASTTGYRYTLKDLEMIVDGKQVPCYFGGLN